MIGKKDHGYLYKKVLTLPKQSVCSSAMNAIQILFNRDSNDVLIVLEFATEGISKRTQLIDALRAGITKWMKETKDGKKAYEYTGGDFNIGDLMATYADDNGFDESLEPYMKAGGIHGIKTIFELTVLNRVSYDKVLCNADEVEAESEEKLA